MTRVVMFCMLLAACNEHGRSPGDGRLSPNDAVNPCAGLDCGGGFHCEMLCKIQGSSSCATDCNRTCVPDQVCAQTDCGTAGQCALTCTHDCGVAVWGCSERCVAPASPIPCELVTIAMDCVGRSDCTALFAADNCTCGGSGCTCTSPRTGTGFLHCVTR